jgi:hypothetical protein
MGIRNIDDGVGLGRNTMKKGMMGKTSDDIKRYFRPMISRLTC